jgi:phage terminase small subunit
VLEALGEDPELCAEPLAAYGRAMAAVAQLRKQWRTGGQLGTILGARGQPIVNPALVALERAERWAAECGAALGLDPQARRRLSRRAGAGRPPGGASAPDRAAPTRRRLRSVP